MKLIAWVIVGIILCWRQVKYIWLIKLRNLPESSVLFERLEQKYIPHEHIMRFKLIDDTIREKLPDYDKLKPNIRVQLQIQLIKGAIAKETERERQFLEAQERDNLRRREVMNRHYREMADSVMPQYVYYDDKTRSYHKINDPYKDPRNLYPTPTQAQMREYYAQQRGFRQYTTTSWALEQYRSGDISRTEYFYQKNKERIAKAREHESLKKWFGIME